VLYNQFSWAKGKYFSQDARLKIKMEKKLKK